MSVSVRPYRTGGWLVDVRVRLADGSRYRDRKRFTASKSAAQRWGQERERHLLQFGLPVPKKEAPTLKEFAPRFIEEFAVANRQKPSEIASKQSILNNHLIPRLGEKRLDALSSADVQSLKHALRSKAPKTVNNILTVLSVMLRRAVEWGVLQQFPCSIGLLKAPRTQMGFWDFDDYARLLQAAEGIGTDTHLIVLLGGDAGLRCGEMIALEWSDIDLTKRQICVQRSEWRGEVTAPKGGRLRYVPMTSRLSLFVERFNGVSGRLLRQDDCAAFSQDMVGDRVRRAARMAGVPESGAHRLRHTFCSHLAMRGAPAGAIQHLAGHKDLATTQRYMHLSPTAIEDAIRLLDRVG